MTKESEQSEQSEKNKVEHEEGTARIADPRYREDRSY